MAIYIQINRKDQDQTGAIYEFGPMERIIGTVFVERATREVSLLHIDDPQKAEFYLLRVRQALQGETDQLPESTFYAA
jgi:hypothetical protein